MTSHDVFLVKELCDRKAVLLTHDPQPLIKDISLCWFRLSSFATLILASFCDTNVIS